MLKKSVIAAAAVLAASSGIACAQDLAAGATSFKKCAPVTTSATRPRTRSARC